MKPELSFRMGNLFVAFCMGMAFAAYFIFQTIDGDDSQAALTVIATQTTILLGTGSTFSLMAAFGQWQHYRKKLSEWNDDNIPF
tara:strand:+ start:352 stop:603 length:252 start_codon:yes stop_codon:yes gene_type:complete